jgi:hypothetical protein
MYLIGFVSTEGISHVSVPQRHASYGLASREYASHKRVFYKHTL